MFKLAEELIFSTKLDLLRISQTFHNLHRVYTAKDYSANEDGIPKFLFVSDEYREQLQSAVRNMVSIKLSEIILITENKN